MKIVVLNWGEADEQEKSKRNVEQIAAALEASDHKVVVLTAGAGLQTDEDLAAGAGLATALRQERPDVCVIGATGCAGASGELQALLEFLDIPYMGAAYAACRKAADKSLLPDVLETYHQLTEDELAATTPVSFTITSDAFAKLGVKAACDLFADRVPGGYPMAVKPATGCYARGVSKVEDGEQLAAALEGVLAESPSAVVQQWIDGAEISVCLLGEGWDAYALPPVEIVADGAWYDEEARAAGYAQLIAPVRSETLSPNEMMASAIRAEIERAAFEAYIACGMRDYGRVDLVWDGAQAHVLEVQVNPDLATGSAFRKALDAAGLSFEAVVNAMVGGL